MKHRRNRINYFQGDHAKFSFCIIRLCAQLSLDRTTKGILKSIMVLNELG